MKQAIIIGGANGSGKTTFSKQIIENTGYVFLNADAIEKELDEPSSNATKIKAGRIFLSQFDTLLSEKASFILESTLAGKYIERLVAKLKQKDYEIIIVYVFLDTPQACIQRISNRVKMGGHHIPNEDVTRRFYRSVQNFWSNYRLSCTRWHMIFNSDDYIEKVAFGNNSEFQIENEILFQKFISNLE